TELGQPAFEIVPHGFKRVQPVDMKEIDRPFAEMQQGVIEGRTDQSRECRIVRIVIARILLENLFRIESGVLVAPPSIDGITLRWKLQLPYGLRKGRVGVAGMRSKLHKNVGTSNVNDPKREWNMPNPRRRP